MFAGIESFAGTPLLVERSRMSATPRTLRLADRERRRIVYRFAVHRSRVVETAAGAFLLPGPVKMHPRVLEAIAALAMNHRSPEFKEILSEIRGLTQYLFATSGEVAVLSGSGTAGLEAAVSGLLRKQDRVLNLVNGKFSERFHELCQVFTTPTALSFEWGTAVDPGKVAAALDSGDFHAVTLCWNETSTGLTNPIAEIAKVVKEHDAFLIVDGITAVGGLENRIARTRRLAEAARAGVDALGLHLYPNRRFASNTVTAIRYPVGVDDAAFRKELREKHGTVVAGGQGPLKGHIFRIGHMGICSFEDLKAGFQAFETSLTNLGHKAVPGAALNAIAKHA